MLVVCCLCQQEVRLYTALCLSDILRIFAPEEPYQDDETLKVRENTRYYFRTDNTSVMV